MTAKHCDRTDKHPHHEWTDERAQGGPVVNWCAGIEIEKGTTK